MMKANNLMGWEGGEEPRAARAAARMNISLAQLQLVAALV